MSCVRTIVWLHHFDFNKTHGDKARWKLFKNAECCFKQFLEATYHKTITARPPISHLKTHPWKTNKTCRTLKNKGALISYIIHCTFIHGHTSVGRPAKTYIHQLWEGTEGRLEDLLRVMTASNREWESRESLMSVNLTKQIGQRWRRADALCS